MMHCKRYVAGMDMLGNTRNAENAIVLKYKSL